MKTFRQVDWDYIIVGAGSAGCALAHELARRRPNDTILIVEAGAPDRSPYIRFACAQPEAVAKHDWGYRSQPDPSRNGAVEGWPRGRVVGGSSSINGTLYARGAAADFERWAARYDPDNIGGWGAADVMPLFRAFENSDQASPLRGKSGPLHVRTVRRPHLLTEAFIKAACASGYSFNYDYNAESQEGVAYAQLSQRGGMRCSAADAFLKPLRGSKNVQLLHDAAVHKIEFEGRRAVAVVIDAGGRKRRETGAEIIVCAGAINSPKLLMLSGVGPMAELARHDIHPVIDLPGVGQNLKEHPLLKLTYRTKVPTYNLTEGLLQRLSIVSEFVKTQEGPISNLFEAVAFLRTAPAEPHPDVQLHFLSVGYHTNAAGAVELAPYQSVTVLLNKSYPVSTGRIRLASAAVNEPPLIECRLLEERADLDTMVRGVRLIRRIMATQPIADLVDSEVAPGPDVDSPAALEGYVRRQTGIAFHPVGTCRMGTDANAVVTPELRVRGTDNLWVADASVMPDLISGNTNAACMMIGAKLGTHLASRRVVEERRIASNDAPSARSHLL